jgi:anaphase-promoting complex subunit 6
VMLGEAKVDEHGNVFDTKDCNAMYLDKDGEDREINVNTSSFCFLLDDVMPNHGYSVGC